MGLAVSRPLRADGEAKHTFAGALAYLRGLALVNNLAIHTTATEIFLLGRDHANTGVLRIGEMDPKFEQSARSLRWDILPFNGSYVVEYPEHHQGIFDAVGKVNAEEYELRFTITTLSTRELRARGVDIDAALSFLVDGFAVVYDSAGVLSRDLSARASGSVKGTWKPEDLFAAIDHSSTSVLTGYPGRRARVQISERIPFVTSTILESGQTVRSSVEYVEAGFIIDVKAFSLGSGLTFDFSVQNSSADFGQVVDDLPTIRQRLTETSRRLEPGQAGEISRINLTEQTTTKRKFFGITRKEVIDEERIVVVAVQRTK
jgi:hypothetical protein